MEPQSESLAKPTIENVAKLAGVSIKTVSRVLNNQPNVRGATKNKVQLAVDTLGYVPNQSARSLASKKSFLLALLYDNPSANYVTDVQEGALSVCQCEGFDLLIHPCQSRDLDLVAKVIALVKNKNLDGLVLTPPLSDHQELISALIENDIHHVLIAPASIVEGSISVVTNDKSVSQAITEMLIGMGHTKIGFITGHPDHKAVQHRYQGYVTAHRAKSIDINSDWVVEGDLSFESGMEAALSLLKKGDRPTAIFASNDDMAAGVVVAAHRLGMNVPGDISIIGFDDIPLAQRVWPPLTTVKQPIVAMSKQAVSLLVRRIRGESISTVQSTEDSQIIVRQSTRALK